MSVTGVSSATSSSAYQATTSASQKPASDGDSPAVEAAESKKTKAAEQANGGTAPKAAPPTAKKSSSSSLAKLKMLVAQHLSASQIAAQLGISVSTVMQQAAAAGLTIGSASTPAGNPDVGNKVDVTA
jgi:DNA-binding NarL/FixJ family response regulator